MDVDPPDNDGGGYHIRRQDDEYDNNDILGMYDELFTIVLNHGGYFTNYPGRSYVNGKQDFVDLLDVNRFGIWQLHLIRSELGYPDDVPTHFHFRKPGSAHFDEGIAPLNDDAGVVELTQYVRNNIRTIDVFVEHGNTNIFPIGTQSSVVLELEGPNDQDVESEKSEGEDDTNTDDDETDSESEKSEGGDSSDDSDYIVDEENEIDEEEVDMRDFKFLVDKEDDPVVENEASFELDVLDNDNFDSASDEENMGTIRSRTLKQLRKAHGKEPGFYVGQAFANKQEVKAFLKNYAIVTRRQLKTIKDEKTRLRVVCDGDVPGFERVRVEKPKRIRKKKEGAVEGGPSRVTRKKLAELESSFSRQKVKNNALEIKDQSATTATSKGPENKNKGGRTNLN